MPTRFVKQEYFSFRGSLRVPALTDTKVSVIFTRVTDQKQLFFSSPVEAGETSFKVMTHLTLTGNFYLSVFEGQSGITSPQ